MRPVTDVAGIPFSFPRRPVRIVSLIPSITEILFTLGLDDEIAGITRYCTEPPEKVKTKLRIGGEKDPDLQKIRVLQPDLVIANMEENRREDVAELRGWGIPVYITYPRTVEQGIALVRELGALTGREVEAEDVVKELEPLYRRVLAETARGSPAQVFCPIWRKPYMTINHDTYVHDMLRVTGGENVFGDRVERYPEVTLDDVAAKKPEVILLPDEPYRFRRAHLEDFTPFKEIPAVQTGRIHLIDGKLISWYGPRIAQALRTLPRLLAGTGEKV